MYLVSRRETFAKLFFLVSFSGLFMYVALAFYSFHTAFSNGVQMPGYKEKMQELTAQKFEYDLKYILLWTIDNNTYDVQEGQGIFIENDCADVNCYITTNKSLLDGHYEEFNAIVFNFTLLHRWQNRFFPERRSFHQKYVFYSRLPSRTYPICNLKANNHFNWTWTYKFRSDIFSPFIEVKDKNGVVVAPRADMVWPKNTVPSTPIMDSIDEVNTKRKAVIWLISDCTVDRNVYIFVRKLQRALKDHYLTLDIYGCGNRPCPKGGCLEAISREYYFYLAIERSATEDYVTDEVLMAYEHDAVPIVVGGADYTKFLPEGSYINYQDLNEVKAAALIAHTIKTPTIYREYFNWKNMYTIHRVDENKGFCKLCNLLNDNKKYKEFSNYEQFRQWWYHGSLKGKCFPKGAETFEEVLSYDNTSTPNQNIFI